MKNRKIKITAIVLLTLILSLNFVNVFADDGISTSSYCTGRHNIIYHSESWTVSTGSTHHTVYISTWETCSACSYRGNETFNGSLESHSFGPERDWHGAGNTHYYSADCQDCTYTYKRSVICKGNCATTDRFIR